jgi:hypothetical protein
MNVAQRTSYFAGYRRWSSDGDAESHFPFWAINVLVRGALFRLGAARGGVEEPIARLRESVEAWR